MSTIDDRINKKIQIVKNILKNVYQILELFKPLLSRLLEMEEAEQYKKNGVFKEAADLFGEISTLCKEIENESLPLNLFTSDLGN